MDSLQEIKVRAIATEKEDGYLMAQAILEAVKGDVYEREPETIDEKRLINPQHHTKSDEVKSSSLTIQPNPFTESTGIFYQVNENTGEGYLKIYDMLGSLVKQFNINSTKQGSITINLKEFQEGVYYCHLVIDGQIIESKKLLMIR